MEMVLVSKMTNMRFIASILLNIWISYGSVIIYAVLSYFNFVAKFTVTNLNKDFTNTGRGGVGVTILWKFFIKSEVFFKGWIPLRRISVWTDIFLRRVFPTCLYLQEALHGDSFDPTRKTSFGQILAPPRMNIDKYWILEVLGLARPRLLAGGPSGAQVVWPTWKVDSVLACG